MSDQKPTCCGTPTARPGTGYGSQTALFATGSSEHYNLGISAFYGIEGSPIKWNGIPVYPGDRQHVRQRDDHRSRPRPLRRRPPQRPRRDAHGRLGAQPGIWRHMNLACWVPIDHEPCPPPIAEFFYASLAVPDRDEPVRRDGCFATPASTRCTRRTPSTATSTGRTTRPKARTTGMPRTRSSSGGRGEQGQPVPQVLPRDLPGVQGAPRQAPDAVLYLHTELSGRFNGVELPDLMTRAGSRARR
jgi:hypothetical protein